MELNPEHAVTKALHEEWYKLLALVMQKHGITRTMLTLEDIRNLGPNKAIIAHAKKDGIELTLTTLEEARRKATQ